MAKDTETKLTVTLGENLVTLAEYYAGNERNLLVVCKTLDLDSLRSVNKLKLKELPFFFTKEELLDAVDVFPVEFLNIRQHHRIIYGQDFLKDIVISKKDLRRQIEFEFRSKLIHLRKEYLQFQGRELEKLIFSALPTLAPILGGLIYIKDLHCDNMDDMFTVVSEGYGLDVHTLKEIYDIRSGKAKFNKDKEQYIQELINVLTAIGKIVDKIELV